MDTRQGVDELKAALPPLARLSLDYLLDSIELSRVGGDVVGRLLLAAIFDANVAPIKRDPALQAAYATLEAPPPEAVRRPVSMNAIAQSLGLPFETVRRRIGRLTAAGVCISTPRGVLLSQAVVASPAFLAIGEARYGRLRRFHDDLVAADLLPPPPDLGAPSIVVERPVRIANRALAEFVMRCIEIVIRPLHDPLTALILLHLVRERLKQTDPRPVSAANLARRTGIPAETVRRRLIVLDAEGYCQRARTGAVPAPDALEKPALAAFVADNPANVQRLFGSLARLGVLAAWRTEDEAADRLAG